MVVIRGLFLNERHFKSSNPQKKEVIIGKLSQSVPNCPVEQSVEARWGQGSVPFSVYVTFVLP